MKRNFGALSGGSAAAVNAGTIGTQKDKIVFLDANAEILYDPSLNVRNEKKVDDDLDGLIRLRLSMDDTDQAQAIRVYPLPKSSLDPNKPQMKYGVAYGHRRMLACRLTSKDSPEIGDLPRKVQAIIDVDWLTRLNSARVLFQIEENFQREDLNYVELGEAIQLYRRERELEEGRSIPQRELNQKWKKLTEKTLGYLIQAANFHELAKTACHDTVLTDLDSLVTFDAICKANEEYARAIFTSLLDKAAPRTRALIRQAKLKIESEPEFKVDPETWVWPDTVATRPANQSAAQTIPPVVQSPPSAPAGGVPSDSPQSQRNVNNAGAGSEGGTENPDASGGSQQSLKAGPESRKQDQTPTSTAQSKDQASNPGVATVQQQPDNSGRKPSLNSAVVMVNFKMGGEAKNSFNGELLVGARTSAPNIGKVAYLLDGKEETVDVPLKYVEIVSISHA